MAEDYPVRPLKDACLHMEGISAGMIAQHHDLLYAGYVDKVNDLQHALRWSDRSQANQTYGELRALAVAEIFALNGAKLHEYYFDNLGGAGTRPGPLITALIERDFGAVEP
jgi:Fe-Mn family superoxide dismutase